MNAEEHPVLADGDGAVASKKGSGVYWFFGLSMAFLVVVVAYVWATSGPDPWAMCDDAISDRLPGPLDYDASEIYWTEIGIDGDERAANGTVHTSAGATYTFQCGVKDDRVEFVDLSPS